MGPTRVEQDDDARRRTRRQSTVGIVDGKPGRSSVGESDVAERLISQLDVPDNCWRCPVLIAIFGLPCTGKTELARYLSSRLPLVTLSTDAIRLRFGLSSGPSTHAIVYEAASMLLPRMVGIVWDGIHLGRRNRVQIREFAMRYGAHVELIYTIASDHVIRQRLEARIAAPEQTTAEGKYVITPEHFEQIARFLEAPGPDEEVHVIDTASGGIDQQLGPLVHQLGDFLTYSGGQHG